MSSYRRRRARMIASVRRPVDQPGRDWMPVTIAVLAALAFLVAIMAMSP